MDIAIALVFAAIFTGGFYLTNLFVIPYLLTVLGEMDTWYSPVRNKPPSGQYAIITRYRFNRALRGAFVGIIHSIKDYEVGSNYDFVEMKDEDKPLPSWFQRRWGIKAGVEWVGFFKMYFISPTEYVAMEKDPETPDYTYISKKRNTSPDDPYYYYQYSTMIAQVDRAEIFGNLQVDMDILFNTIHRNPYKIHFLMAKWAVRAPAMVERGTREYIRNMKFEDLRDEHGSGATSLCKYLEKQSDPDFGFEISKPDLIKFDLVGSQAVRDAVQAREVNRQLADAAVDKNREVVTLAEGQKQAVVIAAQGDREAREVRAEGIKSEFAARSSVPDGASLSWAEAVSVSKPSTIVLGAGSPIAVTPTPRTIVP